MKYSVIFSALLSSSAAISATQEGDILMRARIIDINAQNTGTLTARDSVSLDIDFTYMVSDHFGIELLLDTSSEHDIALGTTDVVTTKVLPPALIAQYHAAPNAAVRPYVGIGINHTIFFDEATTDALPGTDVSLDSSTGLVFQAGVDFDINDDWFVNIDFKKMEINTIARLTGTTTANIDSNLDPVVIGVGIGMKF
ncbi:MAG: outer membrane beta-barrel protein [Gammaproteobacteria bacterium]|nr:outer membrane beta-barrel protein [Gammaproteobacteria bacterium]